MSESVSQFDNIVNKEKQLAKSLIDNPDIYRVLMKYTDADSEFLKEIYNLTDHNGKKNLEKVAHLFLARFRTSEQNTEILQQYSHDHMFIDFYVDAIQPELLKTVKERLIFNKSLAKDIKYLENAIDSYQGTKQSLRFLTLNKIAQIVREKMSILHNQEQYSNIDVAINDAKKDISTDALLLEVLDTLVRDLCNISNNFIENKESNVYKHIIQDFTTFVDSVKDIKKSIQRDNLVAKLQSSTLKNTDLLKELTGEIEKGENICKKLNSKTKIYLIDIIDRLKKDRYDHKNKLIRSPLQYSITAEEVSNLLNVINLTASQIKSLMDRESHDNLSVFELLDSLTHDNPEADKEIMSKISLLLDSINISHKKSITIKDLQRIPKDEKGRYITLDVKDEKPLVERLVSETSIKEGIHSKLNASSQIIPMDTLAYETLCMVTGILYKDLLSCCNALGGYEWFKKFDLDTFAEKYANICWVMVEKSEGNIEDFLYKISDLLIFIENVRTDGISGKSPKDCSVYEAVELLGDKHKTDQMDITLAEYKLYSQQSLNEMFPSLSASELMAIRYATFSPRLSNIAGSINGIPSGMVFVNNILTTQLSPEKCAQMQLPDKLSLLKSVYSNNSATSEFDLLLERINALKRTIVDELSNALIKTYRPSLKKPESYHEYQEDTIINQIKDLERQIQEIESGSEKIELEDKLRQFNIILQHIETKGCDNIADALYDNKIIEDMILYIDNGELYCFNPEILFKLIQTEQADKIKNPYTGNIFRKDFINNVKTMKMKNIATENRYSIIDWTNIRSSVSHGKFVSRDTEIPDTTMSWLLTRLHKKEPHRWLSIPIPSFLKNNDEVIRSRIDALKKLNKTDKISEDIQKLQDLLDLLDESGDLTDEEDTDDDDFHPTKREFDSPPKPSSSLFSTPTPGKIPDNPTTSPVTSPKITESTSIPPFQKPITPTPMHTPIQKTMAFPSTLSKDACVKCHEIGRTFRTISDTKQKGVQFHTICPKCLGEVSMKDLYNMPCCK